MVFSNLVFILITITILLFVNNEISCLNTEDMDRPGRNLCTNKISNNNCSNQVTSSSMQEATCSMRFFNPTQSECSDEEFVGDKDIAASEKYGTVALTPYIYIEKFSYQALNVTFKKIHWERLKIKYFEVGSKATHHCREFSVSENVDESSVISYDCIWNLKNKLNYKFKYLLTTRDGYKYAHTYLFQLPENGNAHEPKYYKMFVIMDQTDYPTISAMVQVPPARLNLSNATITLFYKENVNSSVKELLSKRIDLTNRTEGDFIRIATYDAESDRGYYYYNATCYSGYYKSECMEISSPHLQVTEESHTTLMTFAIILSILAFGTMAYLMWKHKYKIMSEGPIKPPNILFIYESSYPSHIENIYKFKEFLEESCYMELKLDLIDIPKTESKDPWEWYFRSFEKADYVFVFASPDDSTKKGLHQDNIYHNLHIYAYQLLICYLLKKHKFSVATIILPGCCRNTLPPEAEIIRKEFSLPMQLKEMFRFLDVPPVKDGASNLLTALDRSRTPPQLLITKPVAPLKFPENIDEEPREPIVFPGITLNFDGAKNQEENDDDNDNDPFIMDPVLSEFRFS